MADPAASGIESHLIRAAQRILRPLLRIMLRNGITVAVFEELVRKVFVDVAYEEFGIKGKPQTLARVSVITGLNRKEVARLYNLSALDESDRDWRNRASKVLAAWLTDNRYCTDAGFPLDLPFAGAAPSFSDLVKAYSGDMYPRSVADELLRVGAIEEHSGRLRMTERAFVPTADPVMIIDGLGIDTAEFIETVDHNLRAKPDQQLLQLKVYASNLPEKHLREFNEFSKRLSHNAIEEVAHWLPDRDLGSDMSGDDVRYSVGLGMFQINRIRRVGHRGVSTEEDDNDR